MSAQNKQLLLISTIILIVVHTAGFLGICSSSRDLFLAMSPINLLLCFVLLLINHGKITQTFISFMIITFLTGFFIEAAGVRTGLIFGEYHYGKTLGPQVFSVPLIIGINWLTLIYCTGIICNRINKNVLIKSLIGAVMMLILDICLEPVAIKCDFWHWDNRIIPVQNYSAWFAVSFCLLLIFHSMNFKKDNSLAKAIFIIQLVFFILLNKYLN